MKSVISVSKTYSLTVHHIEMVTEMAMVLRVSQGEVLRRAIDLLWNEINRPEIAPAIKPIQQ